MWNWLLLILENWDRMSIIPTSLSALFPRSWIDITKRRRWASVLPSAMYSDVFNAAQSQGFFMLLESADDLAVDILDAGKSYLSAPHHAELVERRGGGSTDLTVDEVKKEIADFLREDVGVDILLKPADVIDS
ncbi:ma3 domain-containing translation regulatory factor 1 [Sesamum alatum]|uniref:Ma3 domain-containing translation regulatory factor 1 n=1 Tax=Sesamum alatum TaxID=300844 RepID=A0AAE1YBM3_9LAMI|nr:ma3 domain-containing translation regulatory factor 1 [Sesamum alatum]